MPAPKRIRKNGTPCAKPGPKNSIKDAIRVGFVVPQWVADAYQRAAEVAAKRVTAATGKHVWPNTSALLRDAVTRGAANLIAFTE